MTETVAPGYRQMWVDLGLDLESHDALMGAVGQLFGDAYLTQQNHPEGVPVR